MKLRRYSVLLFALFLFCLSHCYSQEALGLNPSSLKWRKFKTETGVFIYPQGMDSAAFRAARILRYQRQNEWPVHTFKKTRRVPVVIQNQSTLPQGFAVPSPWRVEIFTISPQNMFMGPMKWLDGVTSHEFRHAQQFWAANRGFTRAFQTMMGETGWLLNALIAQPLWFREGDAVYAETALTNAGRGDLPSFNMEMKALLGANRRFIYDKGTWYSFKDFVPNMYRVGYYMVDYGRAKYGDSLWTDVLHDTYERKGFFWPFARSMKTYTGGKPKDLYVETLDSLQTVVQNEMSSLDTTNYQVISKKGKAYTSYRYPQWNHLGGIVAEVSGYDRLRSIIEIDANGKEKKLITPGIYTTDHNSFAEGFRYAAWAETAFHPRWVNKDYSVITLYDRVELEKIQLTHRSRLFSPAFSPDNEHLVAVQVNTNDSVMLSGWSIKHRSQNWEMNSPGNNYLAHPQWREDGWKIVVIVLNETGNAIIQIDRRDATVDTLLHFSHAPISRPKPAGDTIYFSGVLEDRNEIFALDISSGSVSQLTTSKYGAFEPDISTDRKQMIYSGYTADGYEIRKTDIKNCQWKVVQWPNSNPPSILDTLPKDTFHSSKYHALSNGIGRVTGWFLLPNIVEYGIEVYTRNVMSNMNGTFGAVYNINEKAFRGYFRTSYAGLWPIFDFEGTYGERRTFDLPTSTNAGEPDTLDLRWNERTIGAFVRLPLNLTRGHHQRKMNLRFGYRAYDVRGDLSYDWTYADYPLKFNTLEGEFSFSNMQARVRRFVRPRWGQEINVVYRKGIKKPYDYFEYRFAEAGLNFPGIARTHSFRVEGAHVEHGPSSYRFVDKFQHSRGYMPTAVWRESRLTAEYQFPVWYPDFALGGWAFVQRLRVNLFYDHGIMNSFETPLYTRSFGAELLIDSKLLRSFETEMVLQFSYLIDPAVGTPRPQITFQVSRFEFSN